MSRGDINILVVSVKLSVDKGSLGATKKNTSSDCSFWQDSKVDQKVEV